MKTEHTPGPWTVCHTVDGTPAVQAHDMTSAERNGGMVSALCPGPDGEANACLIAAAPTMKEALLIVCQVLAAERDGEPLPRGWVEELKYLVVDRALEVAEPGFDGGTTTAVEAAKLMAGYRADIAEAKRGAK